MTGDSSSRRGLVGNELDIGSPSGDPVIDALMPLRDVRVFFAVDILDPGLVRRWLLLSRRRATRFEPPNVVDKEPHRGGR
jgi:hypothetical protein